jgi:putative peptide maturation dehydrogenase
VTLRARRTRWATIRCADALYLDVAALLGGQTLVEREPELRAFSALTGEESELTRAELELLLELPAETWSDRASALVDELERKGLVVVEGRESEARDERISAAHWNPSAALYHARGRWSGVDLPLHTLPEATLALGDDAAVEFIGRFGPPPPHFHSVAEPLATLELPLVDAEGGLFEALSRRQTSRVFDRSRSVSLEQLATLLRAVFGAQALATITDDAVGIRKTSPSGGGLHPIEAYPLVCDVEGVEPGVHHYHVGDHALELVERLDEEEARALALAFTCGQGYFREASVLVVLAARFERSFWKYRGHEKAYGVTLMDAGHLSQTFYLVCAELGLGAFVTAAINNVDVDDRLGLDGFAQGSLAIVGCGPLVGESSYLQPAFTAHRPAR